MKKLFTLILCLGAWSFLMAQTVPRDMVMLEIGTGTWCTYCPGAAMGADDLVENGCHVAVCENHNGDPFANPSSNARNTYYGITGYPTAKFDGILTFVGGSHSVSMAPQYYPLYLQRINTPAIVLMSMEVTNSGQDYTAVITMQKIGTIPGGANLKLRFAVTVSNIQYAWQGQTHLNFVNAKMVPDATGTTVSFTGGNIQTVTLNFWIDPTWIIDDIEFLAFLQNDNGKEILQGIKRAAVDLSTDFTASALQVNKNEPVTFSSTVTGGYIHAPVAYQWYFPGATPDTSSQPNPTVVYTECGQHDVIMVVDKGGQIDSLNKTTYISVGPVVNIAAIPNDTACHDVPITLDATTPNAASYLWQPGGATTPTYVVSYPEYGLGAHTFTVLVTGLDGCETSKSITIFIDECTGIDARNVSNGLTVYPNPNNGTFTVEMYSANPVIANLTFTNALGTILYSEHGISLKGKVTKDLLFPDIAPGVYFMTLEHSGTKAVQKVFVR
jgi:PKD repeat protein